VRIKQRTPDSVLVTGKLAVGDMVITEGVQMLRPGSDVAPVEAAASRGGLGAAGRVPVDDPGHAPAITPAIAPTDRGRQRALDVPGRQGAGGDHAAKRAAA
jgi:hypothetical protein